MKIKTIITDARLAELPTRGTIGSAAVDLRAMIDAEHPQTVDDGAGNLAIRIHPGQTLMIDTGMKVHIKNHKYAGLIMARSGLASKKGLAPANKVGLIDSDYQGPLMVAIHNSGGRIQTIEQGERIAQLVIVPIAQIELDLVESFEDETERGEDGFGSTGEV